MSDPDAQLMTAFAAGQEDAFVQLYERYRERIVNYCRRLLGDRARAEEAAQDVFLKVYDAGSRYQAKSRFSTYIYRVATNHCFNLNARVERKLVSAVGSESDRADPKAQDQTEAIAQVQLRRALQSALAKLPDKQRAALLLVHYEGLSYREAAIAVSATESAVKSLIHRARERMIRELSSVMREYDGVQHAM
ncbi:MAG: RNA polymerase sigma factor [Myxococcales bacterium]|nr:RNA polymerase sigma factor [Myxococcales bacterium]